MEGPASMLCLRTCYIKDCKPLRFAENPAELGQSHLSRSYCCSRRLMKPRRSNSISMCTLPIIPEYPGFQDVKDLQRGRRSSSQLNNFPNRASLVHHLGNSSRGYLKGHSTPSSGFHDKPLQEYFNERLMELRNYESKRSNRKTKVFADKNQHPFLTRRGSRRRSSCGAVVMMGHDQESEEPCSSASDNNKKVMKCNGQEATQNVLDLYKGDFLDILTTHIAAPLEAFVQKK